MTPPNTSSSKLLDTSVIALLPAFAYAFAYTYERGYARHFRLPTEFIHLDLERILSVGGALVLLVVYLPLALQMMPRRATPIVLRRIILPTFVGTIAWLMFHAGVGWWLKAFFLLASAYMVLADLVLPSFHHSGSFLDRWDAENKKDSAIRVELFSKTLWGATLERAVVIGVDLSWFLRLYYFIWAGLVLSYWGGMFFASRERQFLVDRAHPESVIVRKWGESLVIVGYDSTSNSLTATVRIIPVTEIARANLTLRVFADIQRPPPPETTTVRKPPPAATPSTVPGAKPTTSPR